MVDIALGRHNLSQRPQRKHDIILGGMIRGLQQLIRLIRDAHVPEVVRAFDTCNSKLPFLLKQFSQPKGKTEERRRCSSCSKTAPFSELPSPNYSTNLRWTPRATRGSTAGSHGHTRVQSDDFSPSTINRENCLDNVTMRNFEVKDLVLADREL